MTGSNQLHYAYLSGGVGGARLARGLCDVLPPEQLTLIVNTADDFQHWGLHIAPDLDTVMYSVTGLGHEARGWGLLDERFDTLAAMAPFESQFPTDATTWFQLGNRDLATHLVRSAALARGERLTDVTRGLCLSLGLQHPVLPMSDALCPSFIHTVAEPGDEPLRLSFQDWLVKRRARDRVARVELCQTGDATPEVLAAVERADVVLIAPSNPYVSIDPILQLPGVREAVEQKPCVAVSPIIGGKAVKGPLAEMLGDISGLPASPASVVQYYAGLLGACLVERSDLASCNASDSIRWEPADTLMTTREASVRLAERMLEVARALVGAA